ncbi:unnamed protein product (macronuclear) [Paramecium tetraurelia]|uniref:Uncharacterized protein n=1 Tax=Paramecium tetraurelia TaxID=5888 RepID=A0C5D7_PARTE|nr:uncharacterized protein GSPATT00006503001 [Paramecium tetraurelia]CAK66004.1 unnamed protein product [Paramecium tetraurelia]|eukprot:XP_001433401.1 hypothetical protein (macronuclear) [Paramecium tetraurelia strain d4-2]
MNQQSFVQVTQEYDQVKKRVNSLKFQLRDIDQKNYLLSTKIKDLRQISPKIQKSPISQLQEQLRLDRKQIIEQFKPIVEKEGIYLRNERLKTETQLQQSKIWEIQQKKMKVKMIDEFDSEVTKRRAAYQEKKIKEVRQQQLQEMLMNRVIVNKKLLEINKLKKQEKDLIEEIQSAKTKEQQLCNKFCNALVSNDNTVILPSIQKSNSRTSQNSNQKKPNKGCSPFRMSGKVFDRLQRSETRNDNSIIEYEENRKFQLDSRKKSQSIDQLNIACQTTFLIKDQNLESAQYSNNQDSYLGSQKDKTIEKSQENQTSEERKEEKEKNKLKSNKKQ